MPALEIVPQKGDGLRLYGGRYPSVTTALKVIEKSYLDAWRSRVGHAEADKQMRNAQVFGTKIHAVAHAVALGKAPTLDEQTEPFLPAIEGFLSDKVAEVILAEKSYTSERFQFGGTLDLYARFKDGSLGVVDWKTNKGGLTREHGLQTAGYGLLAKDAGLIVNRRYVVRIKQEKPGVYHCREYIDHAGDAKAFLACVVLWNWQNKNKVEKIIKAAQEAKAGGTSAK